MKRFFSGIKGFIFGMSFVINLLLGLFTAAVFILLDRGEDLRDYWPNSKEPLNTESKSEKKETTIGFHS